MNEYDLIIIGGGPGGYKAAELAGKYGLKVALVEKNKLGGTCLNYGCIPLKGYLHIARIINAVDELHNDSIFDDPNVSHINQNSVLERNQYIINNLWQGIKGRLHKAGVITFAGKANIVSGDERQITVMVDGLSLSAKNLIIAAGSHEIRFPVDDEKTDYNIIYSDELFSMTDIPKRMVILGAGVIGLEAADYFNAIGCEIIVLEAASEIGGGMDSDIAASFRKILQRKGIHIHLNATVKKYGAKELVVDIDGENVHITTESVLIAVGRTPIVEGYGLEKCDVAFDQTGIIIDEACRTNKHNIYACGDVTGKCMLAHTAYEQARIAVDSIMGKEAHIDYNLIPKVYYTSPEVMTVGLSEKECMAGDISYMTKELPLTYSGKYFAEHKKDGAKAKMVIDSSTKTLIGFSMIGDGASEIALAVEVMIANKLTMEDIRKLIFPHPTVGEIIHELAAMEYCT